ncbi:MAG: nicotinamide mononucleotide transporter [Holophagaceae bacterium]|nr:nicotinamide mononucleotide transporter [Holophagaceae bacterium]
MPGLMEVFGFVTGAACVALLVRQNIWNWPLGIANNFAFIVLFYRTGLYADVGLQGFYIAISLYGWWSWLHQRHHGALSVSQMKPRWSRDGAWSPRGGRRRCWTRSRPSAWWRSS